MHHTNGISLYTEHLEKRFKLSASSLTINVLRYLLMANHNGTAVYRFCCLIKANYSVKSEERNGHLTCQQDVYKHS